MSQIQSTSPRQEAGPSKPSATGRTHKRFLRVGAAVLLYGVSGQDLWFSDDSGVSWVHRSHFKRGDLVAFVVDPWHPTHLYAGFFQPALVMYSVNGGSSWQTLTD